MKNKTLKICVLDDEIVRQSHYNDLERSISLNLKSENIGKYNEVNIKFISLDGVDPGVAIIENSKEIESCDINIIDHSLVNASGDLFGEGNTLTALVKNKNPNAPVICVTACENLDLNNYDDIFKYGSPAVLSDYLPLLAEGFNKIKSIKNSADLISAFDIPDDSEDIFWLTLPVTIIRSLRKNNLISNSISFKLYYWFRSIFYKYPGFLYSSKWVAMTCGIKHEFFEEYKDKMVEFSYKGIWNEPSEPRWWKEKLIKYIYEKGDHSQELLLPEVACSAFLVKEEHRSICYKCKKLFPDILALVDLVGQQDEFEPMHIECTNISPEHVPQAFYESVRYMSD